MTLPQPERDVVPRRRYLERIRPFVFRTFARPLLHI